MTLDERIAKEQRTVARINRALKKGYKVGRNQIRLAEVNRILAELEKVKQLPGI